MLYARYALWTATPARLGFGRRSRALPAEEALPGLVLPGLVLMQVVAAEASGAASWAIAVDSFAATVPKHFLAETTLRHAVEAPIFRYSNL